MQSYLSIKKRIEIAAQNCQRSGDEIRLVAVSKSQPLEKIRAVYSRGQIWFGENYVQELEKKAEALKDLSILWSYIGALQSNKIKILVKVCSEIQSVATSKHASLIAANAKLLGKTPYPIYLLLNSGEEATKSGVSFAELPVLAAHIQSNYEDALELRGIMAIPPLWDEASSPSLYKKIAKAASGIGKGLLSLGMSQDLESAISVGATTVRVGTALFGERGK